MSVSSPTMTRDALTAGLRAALERSCPGSRTALLGSLASGTADEYSDIDVEWIVPDDRFAASVASAPEVLAGVHPVAGVRTDPDPRAGRLLFVRFAGVPLFWRLDLLIRTETGPEVSTPETEWSLPASALANATGAIKAIRRGRPDTARGLLDRGFARIGEPDEATGAWADDVARLARAAVAREPGLGELAEEVVALL